MWHSKKKRIWTHWSTLFLSLVFFCVFDKKNKSVNIITKGNVKNSWNYMSENLKYKTKIHLSAMLQMSLSLLFWILFTTPLQWENDINNFLCRCFSNTYLFIHITLMRVYESWDFNKKRDENILQKGPYGQTSFCR